MLCWAISIHISWSNVRKLWFNGSCHCNFPLHFTRGDPSGENVWKTLEFIFRTNMKCKQIFAHFSIFEFWCKMSCFMHKRCPYHAPSYFFWKHLCDFECIVSEFNWIILLVIEHFSSSLHIRPQWRYTEPRKTPRHYY